MTVYVLHLDPPYKHAGHYIGYTPDATADRRVGEHLVAGPKASPLIVAAIRAGSVVRLAHVVEGDTAGRDFERWLKARADTRKWCPCCAVGSRPLPDPSRITGRFRASKVDRSAA